MYKLVMSYLTSVALLTEWHHNIIPIMLDATIAKPRATSFLPMLNELAAEDGLVVPAAPPVTDGAGDIIESVQFVDGNAEARDFVGAPAVDWPNSQVQDPTRDTLVNSGPVIFQVDPSQGASAGTNCRIETTQFFW
jgi:hypothetical protein